MRNQYRMRIVSLGMVFYNGRIWGKNKRKLKKKNWAGVNLLYAALLSREGRTSAVKIVKVGR